MKIMYSNLKYSNQNNNLSVDPFHVFNYYIKIWHLICLWLVLNLTNNGLKHDLVSLLKKKKRKKEKG